MSDTEHLAEESVEATETEVLDDEPEVKDEEVEEPILEESDHEENQQDEVEEINGTQEEEEEEEEAPKAEVRRVNGSHSANTTPQRPTSTPRAQSVGQPNRGTPIRNVTLTSDHTFSPSISTHPSFRNRSGSVFDKLYEDAVQRRAKLEQKREDAKNSIIAKQSSPEVSNYANKTTRTKNVFEALYADAEQRREKRANRGINH
eukprot:TRINITY_DN303_c0_g1_i1.p1 TRINITY_DN303_c0_g1~~TRINITY_DN303_c0_g1_i1.p1  ORF type:complete len:203 (+),score=68.90 TRINITY_DN303_c0_g1_i1:117-725(+)